MSTIFGYFLGYKTLAERITEYNEKIKQIEFAQKNPKIPPKKQEEIITDIKKYSKATIEDVFYQLDTSLDGLSFYEIKKRIFQYGLNEVEEIEKNNFFTRLGKIIFNPLILLFFFLIFVSYLTQDYKTVFVISFMVLISVVLRYIQETKAYNSAAALKSRINTTCTVIRGGKKREIDLKDVTPGDIVVLSAGDIIPADLRLIEAKDLYIDQSFLTGESVPVEKITDFSLDETTHVIDYKNICFMGSSVSSGYGKGVVFQTGKNTYFGNLTKNISGRRTETSFDKGVDKFTWLMIAFMSVMAPTVFIVNGLTKDNWFEAFLFGISIAVGLTPEMLPAILTFNLSKGTVSMAKKKVIVKLLNSMQNLGAMNVVCTDKTGTLTLNRVTVIHSLDGNGNENPKVLKFAYINSFFQTGFKNLIDTAVISEAKKRKINDFISSYKKIDEYPFDFKRKRLSIVVENEKKEKILICKGAVEEVMSVCRFLETNQNKQVLLKETDLNNIKQLNENYAKQGYRTMVVAYKKISERYYGHVDKDEKDLIFFGIITLLDPPKESAKKAIRNLSDLGITVKILTGDNELVTKKIAADVGLNTENILLGGQIQQMSDEELKKIIDKTTIFAKLSPEDKKRIVKILRKKGNVVGFLGDGINDAPALREADVGISVDGGVDIAKESADIILLETSLSVLADGVVEGRKTFGNIIKYIRMGASSNFGNMFSVLGPSIFLPFLPMRPAQILVNNLLYDISQTAIPLDSVDEEFMKKPRRWRVKDIARFMIFIGPISSIFDYTTFFVMLYVFNCWNNPALFQTGWFVESLITQTLIIHVIRSKKIPILQTMASLPLTLMTILIISIGVFLVNSPFGYLFGFVKPPLIYWPILILINLSYVVLTQIVKYFYIKKFGYY
ncbi:MAG: magnesium-translocating P-type ATPase [Patescibacteria group bacterium]|nr:magnesium-translocating P-type ATPase [Patescibacteria group bacterium]